MDVNKTFNFNINPRIDNSTALLKLTNNSSRKRKVPSFSLVFRPRENKEC